MGGWRQANWKWVTPCDWLEVHIWLFLVGSQSEAETKIRNTVSCQSSPGHLRPVIKRVLVWLSGLSSRNTDTAFYKSGF